MPIRTLFFGTPQFAVPILQMLCTHPDLEMVCVIAQPDKPVGRKQLLTPPPTKIVAQNYAIPVYQPTSLRNEESIKNIASYHPELIIVAAYGKIVPEAILAIPKYQCLNVHPSDLPKYRGASPLQYTIWKGEKETKTTIMVMEPTLDTGPMVAKSESYHLSTAETYVSLEEKLAHISAQLLSSIIPLWCSGLITTEKQDDKHATFTKILTKDDGRIDWQQTASEIDCQIRALNPWPSTYTFFDQTKRVKILQASISATSSTEKTGTILWHNEQVLVVCGKQTTLQINTLQIEGKRSMKANEFIAGYPQAAHHVLV